MYEVHITAASKHLASGSRPVEALGFSRVSGLGFGFGLGWASYTRCI